MFTREAFPAMDSHVPKELMYACILIIRVVYCPVKGYSKTRYA